MDFTGFLSDLRLENDPFAPVSSPGNGNGNGNGKGVLSGKAAHVNMMTDAVIANLPPQGLRSILRKLLDRHPSITPQFNSIAVEFLAETKPTSIEKELYFTSEPGQPSEPTRALKMLQRRYRCLMGCGFGFLCLENLSEIVWQVALLGDGDGGEKLRDTLAIIDADIVQAVTAVQKELLSGSGSRDMTESESEVVNKLLEWLVDCKQNAEEQGLEFVFERGLARLLKLNRRNSLPEHRLRLDYRGAAVVKQKDGRQEQLKREPPPHSARGYVFNVESFLLGNSKVPRMFMGLWQFSSPAWGTATNSRIHNDFRKHVNSGFTAYDMADHYGDAEVTFGQFRSSQPDASQIFCATKYCVFEPVILTKEAVEANITERLRNINADHIDLLQLHWQDYDDHQYITMAKLVAADPRVSSVGLCNFDTKRMNEIVESGVNIVSNQVQFSLIDARPTIAMGASCLKHNVKLLTYGSLCGGFLADKWLQKPPPDLYSKDMTPSHRKYYAMITQTWGSWGLFQELLLVLHGIALTHDVSISNVATRWVLEHEYVGAVIIGARMGVSEHVEENRKVFGWHMWEDDFREIQEVLVKSKAYNATIEDGMGDCGDEYRR